VETGRDYLFVSLKLLSLAAEDWLVVSDLALFVGEDFVIASTMDLPRYSIPSGR
jgi:hypothetical protein